MLRLSLLLVLSVALPAQTALEARAELAIKRGCRWLKLNQRDDGTLGHEHPRVGAHALCMLALLSSGEPTDSPVIKKALAPLRQKTDQTYDIAVRLMVLEKLRKPSLKKLARYDMKRLVDYQCTGGGWTYKRAQAKQGYDNSNTQYAILGLRAADKMGLQVPTKTWRRALSHVLAQQHGDGGVGYTRMSRSTPSMTAGALSSIVVCLARAELSADHKHVKRARLWINAQIRFLAKEWTPDEVGHLYYTLYGLERAMAFSDSRKLGERDWYEEGARFLVDEQAGHGTWNAAPVETAFAILFLNRPTRPTARETPGDVSSIMRSLGPQSRPQDIAEAVRRIIVQGRDVATILVHYLEDEVPAIRDAAVQSLRRLYGKRLGYVPARSPRANAAAIAAWRKLVRG